MGSTTSAVVIVLAACACLLAALSLVCFYRRRQSHLIKEQEMVTIVTTASSTATKAPCSGESHAPGVCFLTDVEGNWEYFTVSPPRTQPHDTAKDTTRRPNSRYARSRRA
jgi:hypothetical protein